MDIHTNIDVRPPLEGVLPHPKPPASFWEALAPRPLWGGSVPKPAPTRRGVAVPQAGGLGGGSPPRRNYKYICSCLIRPSLL